MFKSFLFLVLPCLFCMFLQHSRLGCPVPTCGKPIFGKQHSASLHEQLPWAGTPAALQGLRSSARLQGNHFIPGFTWSSEAQFLPRHSFSITHKEGSQWVLLATPQPTPSYTAPLGAHFPTAFGPQLPGKKLPKYVFSQLRVAASSCSCYSKNSLVFFSLSWPIPWYIQ